MSVDIVLRTLGTLACLYTVGLLVTVMSLASLETAGLMVTAAPPCAPSDCRAVATHHLPPASDEIEQHGILAAAAFFAGKL